MSKADIHRRVPESIDMASLLEQHRWSGGVRFQVQGSMRAPVVDGNVTLEAGWRADVFIGRERRAYVTIVAETPEQLFSDIAALCTEGDVAVKA